MYIRNKKIKFLTAYSVFVSVFLFQALCFANTSSTDFILEAENTKAVSDVLFSADFILAQEIKSISAVGLSPDFEIENSMFPKNSTSSVCGNNTQEGAEICDGNDLGGVLCAHLGFSSGTLTCQNTCDGYDTSACIQDGSGGSRRIIENNEGNDIFSLWNNTETGSPIILTKKTEEILEEDVSDERTSEESVLVHTEEIIVGDSPLGHVQINSVPAFKPKDANEQVKQESVLKKESGEKKAPVLNTIQTKEAPSGLTAGSETTDILEHNEYNASGWGKSCNESQKEFFLSRQNHHSPEEEPPSNILLYTLLSIFFLGNTALYALKKENPLKKKGRKSSIKNS